MNISRLKQLLAQGETRTVIFDPRVDGKALSEAAVSLANAEGGHILIGVDDSGRLVGFNDSNPQRLYELLIAATEPPIEATVESVTIDGTKLAVIEVQAGKNVFSTTSGKYLRRTLDVRGKPQCVPMRPHEIISRAGSIGQLDYSLVAMPAVSMDDLSEDEFDRFRGLANQIGDKGLANLSNQDLLKALNLSTANDDLTVGALLLFGKEESLRQHLPTHEVGFQELENLAVRFNHRTPAPLLQAMVELFDRVMARNPEDEIYIGPVRVPIPRFSSTAVRDLIANALIHRDYAQLGTTLVQIDGDSLTISNPGGFPHGINSSNLLEVLARPRNPALAEAFKRVGLVERVGRGINRAFANQIALGRPAPEYSQSDDNKIIATIPSGPSDIDLARYVATAQQDGQVFSLQDLMALSEVRRTGRITPARAARLFGVDESTALSQLNRLAEEGILVARVDPIQQEELVLAHVREHGAITRSQATEICHITPAQATYLLRRLRQAGKLRMEGSYKKARYVVAGPVSSEEAQ